MHMKNLKAFFEDNFPTQEPAEACESMQEDLEALSEKYGGDLSIFHSLINAIRLDLDDEDDENGDFE